MIFRLKDIRCKRRLGGLQKTAREMQPCFELEITQRVDSRSLPYAHVVIDLSISYLQQTIRPNGTRHFLFPHGAVFIMALVGEVSGLAFLV